MTLTPQPQATMAAYGKAPRKASAPLPQRRPLFSLLFTGNYQRRADRRPQESLVLVEDEREKTAYDDLILLKYH
jgi:hypothetical protein